MNDTDNGKHELCRKVGRLGAIIMQQEQIIAVLRAEVKASREFALEQSFRCACGECQWNTSSEEFKKALHDLNAAERATDAADALEPNP